MEVVGVDIAPSMIELAEKLNRRGDRCSYVLNESDDLRAFGDGGFDLIHSNITLQHMEPRYAFRYIKEFLRVLSGDGLLVFHMPSERTGRNTLDYLPRRLSVLLQWLLLGGAMEMHGIEKNTIVTFIEGNGGTVLRVKPSDSAGGAWETYEYFGEEVAHRHANHISRTASSFPVMRRVVVVGTSGTGKTTVASRIAEAIDAPHVELDSLHWEPGWKEAPVDVFRSRAAEATTGEKWVADGNYRAVRDILWGRADTVVWLDYPLRVALLRVVRRTVRRILTREELWNGNREGLSALVGPDSMPFWVLKTHRRRRREYPELFASPEYGHLTVVRHGSTDETELWLAGLSESQR